jgi:lysyl-tRNA synthetase class 2
MGNEQREIRIQKLKELRAQGVVPYRDRFDKTHNLHDASMLEEGIDDVKVAGRIIAVRAFGRLIFATLRDGSGDMQVALQEKELGKETFSFFKKYIDIGDFIGAEGSIFRTKKGEITLDIHVYTLLSKTIRPLPEKWHGVTDTEIRYRQRYLDLLMNRETMARFLKRTNVIRVIRNYLDGEGFIEVETPVLQTKPSGAIATPFATHHNALNMDLYLRIAPETYLKRCIAGGFERVYEFARSFRNEGMDPSHLQDFTMLEYYVAYWNYEDNMRFTEQMIKHVLREIEGRLSIEYGDITIDFDMDWPRISIHDLILKDTDIDIASCSDEQELRSTIEKRGIEIQDMEKMGFGSLVDNLYKKVSRPRIRNPLFIMHHPIELSPLARRNDANPAITDRFQLVVNGWEIVNAYSELVDPVDQRERLEKQMQLHNRGDSEAMVMDEDFLTAMEHGMPPVSGWGMGIDRFISLLTGQENLRDVILFPLMKPREESEKPDVPLE